MVGDFPVEVHVMCQDENLLDVVAFHDMALIVGIIVADLDHLPDERAYDEQRSAVHAGHRVIDDHDFILERIAALATTHKVVEVKERNKVPFAFAQLVRNGAVRTDDLVDILNAFLAPEAEPLKTGVMQQCIDARDGSLRIHDLFVELTDFCSDFTAIRDNDSKLCLQSADFTIKRSSLAVVLGDSIFQVKRQILPHMLLALDLLRSEVADHIVVGLNPLIELINDGAELNEESVGILQGRNGGGLLYLRGNTLKIDGDCI